MLRRLVTSTSSRVQQGYRAALSRVAVAGIVAAAMAVSPASRAQSPAEVNLAKQTAGDGLNAYTAGEFDKALGLFTQAKKIYPSGQILRMIGYSEVALEHWDKALDALEGALAAKIAPLSKDDRKDTQDQLAKVMAHIGIINVSSKVPGAQITVDGGELRALPLDKPLRLVEGLHKLVVTAPDHLDAASDLKVEGGKTVDLPLDPSPKPKALPPPLPVRPPPPPERGEVVPHQRAVGFGVLGGGAAFGVAALVTIIEAAHYRSMANSDVAQHLSLYGSGCAMGDVRLCSYDITVTNDEANLADQLRNVAAGLGVTAGVLAATGLVFVVLAPKAKAPPSDGALPRPEASVRCGLWSMRGGPGLLCAGAF